MTTLAFDSDGRCICAVNVSVDRVAFTDAAVVVEIDAPFSANEVWYNFESKSVEVRAPARVVVTKNTIRHIPPGTIAVVGGEIVNVQDGTLELEVEHDQSVPVTLISPRFLDTKAEVPCEAAR